MIIELGAIQPRFHFRQFVGMERERRGRGRGRRIGRGREGERL